MSESAAFWMSDESPTPADHLAYALAKSRERRLPGEFPGYEAEEEQQHYPAPLPSVPAGAMPELDLASSLLNEIKIEPIELIEDAVSLPKDSK